MQKVKHDFQVATKKYSLEMSAWYKTADKIALLFSIVILVYCSNYQLHTALWTSCNSNLVALTQAINTHTEHLVK